MGFIDGGVPKSSYDFINQYWERFVRFLYKKAYHYDPVERIQALRKEMAHCEHISKLRLSFLDEANNKLQEQETSFKALYSNYTELRYCAEKILAKYAGRKEPRLNDFKMFEKFGLTKMLAMCSPKVAKKASRGT